MAARWLCLSAERTIQPVVYCLYLSPAKARCSLQRLTLLPSTQKVRVLLEHFGYAGNSGPSKAPVLLWWQRGNKIRVTMGGVGQISDQPDRTDRRLATKIQTRVLGYFLFGPLAGGGSDHEKQAPRPRRRPLHSENFFPLPQIFSGCNV